MLALNLRILASVLPLLWPGPSPRQPELGDFAVKGIRDLEATVTVAKADLAQLEKINKDFGILYRLRDVTIRYKEPDKFRVDSRLGVFIVNGSMRFLKVPQLGLKKRDDMGAELGKRHSLLDVGLITPTRLDQMRARYVRSETVRGLVMPVFEVSFSQSETAKYLLWLDPAKKLVARRRWLDNGGDVRATFDYLEPVEAAPGIWIPTRIEVRNDSAALAGATVYRDLKVNRDPEDSLFSAD